MSDELGRSATMGVLPTAAELTDAETGDSELLIKLLGQPHLADYLSLVQDKVIGGHAMNMRVVADEWRHANDLYHEMETREAGLADGAGCLAPPRSVAGRIAALEADPHYARTFDTLPTQIRRVELAKLVVSQASVTCGFTDDLRARLGAAPTHPQLFDFCLPRERSQAPVKVTRLSGGRYLFVSDSTDFRVHDDAVLAGELVSGLATYGPVSHVLALPVGYGSNFVSVVESEGRLLLQNGYHRCYSLLVAGFTHAYAVVQHVTRLDELRIAASTDVCDDPAFYFRAKRPPVLGDFLNPDLTRRLLVKKMRTTVEIEVKVRSSTGTVL